MYNNTQRGANMPQAILRLPAVKARIGLSRSSIYLLVSKGSFPRPVSLGARAVGWLESDIEGWLDSQVKQSRNADEIRRKRIAALRGAPAPQSE